MPEDLKRFTISIKSWHVCFMRFQITLLQDRQTDRQRERERERERERAKERERERRVNVVHKRM